MRLLPILFVSLQVLFVVNDCSGQRYRLPYPDKNLEFARDVILANEGHSPQISLMEPLTAGTVGVPIDNWFDPATFTAVQVIDKSNVIARFGSRATYWISNLPTDNLIDGQDFKVPGWAKVVGNKTYITAGGGSKTIVQFEVVEPPKELQELQAEVKKKKPNKRNLRIQTWIGNDKTLLVARFEYFKENELKVTLLDGTTKTIKSDDLSSKSRSTASRLQRRYNKK